MVEVNSIYRILILQPLADLRSLRTDILSAELGAEPKHPHTGASLAKFLAENGIYAVFTNQLPWKLPIPKAFCTNRSLQNLNALLQLSDFDGVVAYADGGVNFLAVASSVFPAVRVFPILLCFPRPRHWFSQVLHSLSYQTTLKNSAAVVCCLYEVQQFYKKRSSSVGKFFYAPTGVDIEFFTSPSMLLGAPSGFTNEPFILAVGDSSRDDYRLYRELRSEQLRIVRVTRDKSIIPLLEGLINRERGDIILSQISFAELRWLYCNAMVVVFASRLDHWQAAGSTALTEALACGAICLVQGGGCVEREFTHLESEAGTHRIIQYFSSEDTAGIRRGVEEAKRISVADRAFLRRGLQSFASSAIPVDRAHKAILAALQLGLRGKK